MIRPQATSRRIRVGVCGYGPIGRRVADAVARQSDMKLVGVSEADEPGRQILAARGLPAFSGHAGDLAATYDAIVDCLGHPGRPPVLLFAPRGEQHGARALSVLSDARSVRNSSAVKIPSADAVALARLVRELTPVVDIERLSATIITRAGHATDTPAGPLNALEPLSPDLPEDRELLHVLRPAVPRCHICRVRGPQSHGNVHVLKLDLAAPACRTRVLAALWAAPRVLVGRAADGLTTTAHVREFFRDLGPDAADRWEAFVWAESVCTFGRSMTLMMDVDPDATPIPETIDAIRLGGRTDVGLAESMRRTDRALGIGTNSPARPRPRQGAIS